MTHTAVGPESYGRGGIANIYNQKSQKPKPLELLILLELLKPLHVIDMAHFAHTAVGPESYGRGGVSDIYDEKSHSSLMKMLRHSVGSPWHWSSICSLGKIGCLRSQ